MLIDATQAMMQPTSMCCGAICISQSSGAAWSNASEAGMGLTAVESSSGGDTQAGGLKSDSYPGSGAGRDAGVILVFKTGLS